LGGALKQIERRGAKAQGRQSFTYPEKHKIEMQNGWKNSDSFCVCADNTGENRLPISFEDKIKNPLYGAGKNLIKIN
jgi:hypothetical protein